MLFKIRRTNSRGSINVATLFYGAAGRTRDLFNDRTEDCVDRAAGLINKMIGPIKRANCAARARAHFEFYKFGNRRIDRIASERIRRKNPDAGDIRWINKWILQKKKKKEKTNENMTNGKIPAAIRAIRSPFDKPIVVIISVDKSSFLRMIASDKKSGEKSKLPIALSVCNCDNETRIETISFVVTERERERGRTGNISRSI